MLEPDYRDGRIVNGEKERNLRKTPLSKLMEAQISKCNLSKEDIDRIADISTNAEINANNCEFEADDMKKAEYMEGRIGEVFDAKIVSIISSGFFVVLENTIEGLVSIKDLKDDRYYYSEEKGYLIGTRYNRIYKIGDKLKVVCT